MKSQRVGGGAGRVRGRTISNMYTAAVFHETQIFLFFFSSAATARNTNISSPNNNTGRYLKPVLQMRKLRLRNCSTRDISEGHKASLKGIPLP